MGVIALGIGAVTGIAQYYQAEKARKASQQRLDKIEALFRKLVPPNYDLSIEAPPEMHTENLEKNFAKELPKTKFDKSLIKQVGEFLPDFPKLVKEEAPQLLKETKITKEDAERQREAIKEFDRIAKSETDPRFRLLVERAKKRAQSEAQSRGETIKTNMARRGISGSGLEMAAQLGSSASAMDRLADIEMQAAADAYKNRLEALATGSDLSAKLANRDMDKQRYNLDLINKFNERMSERSQKLEDRRSELQNEANIKNLRERQRLEELNRSRGDVIAGREAEEARMDVNRADKIKEWTYRQRLAERDRLNKLRRQQYEDQLSQFRGMAGLEDARRTSEEQSSRDKISAIGTLGDTAGKLSMLGARAYDPGNKLSEQEQTELERYRKMFSTMEKRR